MPQPNRLTGNVLQVMQPIYRHIGKTDYIPSEWWQDAESRLILHADSCSRLTSPHCNCFSIDILHVRYRGG
jgi:hypothetical protein